MWRAVTTTQVADKSVQVEVMVITGAKEDVLMKEGHPAAQVKKEEEKIFTDCRRSPTRPDNKERKESAKV